MRFYKGFKNVITAYSKKKRKKVVLAFDIGV